MGMTYPFASWVNWKPSPPSVWASYSLGRISRTT